MIHTFNIEVARSTRVDVRLPGKHWVMRFTWKADGMLVESGEYAADELEKLVKEIRPSELHYRQFASALRKLRAMSSG